MMNDTEIDKLKSELVVLRTVNSILRSQLDTKKERMSNSEAAKKDRQIAQLKTEVSDLREKIRYLLRVLNMSRVTGGFNSVDAYQEALKKESKRLGWAAWEDREKRRQRREKSRDR